MDNLQLAKSGAGNELFMSITERVSRGMLLRHSYLRMEAKRRAVDEVAARERAADEKRKKERRELFANRRKPRLLTWRCVSRRLP